MKRILSMLLCASAAAACGGSAADPSLELSQPRATSERSASGPDARAALFAADAELSALIQQLGPVEGLARRLRGNALYVAENINIVQGKQNIRAAVAAANPDAAHTQLRRTLAGGDVSADGRFGFTFGWLQKTAPASDGSPLTTFGTYVSAWTREDVREEFRVDAYYTRVSLTPHLPTRDGFPLLLGGAGAQGVPRPDDLERQRRSLLRTDTEFAAFSVAHGYSDAFVAYAAPFAMPFGRNFFFLEGRQEVADFYAGWTPIEVLDWTPLFAGASPSGDLGYTVGTSIDAITNPDGTVDRFYGKYLTLWTRQPDGNWRFIADGGAASPPPAP